METYRGVAEVFFGKSTLLVKLDRGRQELNVRHLLSMRKSCFIVVIFWCCVCVDNFGNNSLVVDIDVDSPLLDGPQLKMTPRSSPLQE